MVDVGQYKVGVVLSVEDSARKGAGGQTLKICSIDIGNSDQAITVVTSAPNVRDGSRIVVAPVGSTVLSDEGEEIKVTKAVVGGVASEGMLCDSRMLGWAGGAAGIAVQIPESFELGSAPPSSKPRPKQEAEAAPDGPVTGGLFERKLTKEEKKRLAAEKRAAKKAAKEAKKAEES